MNSIWRYATVMAAGALAMGLAHGGEKKTTSAPSTNASGGSQGSSGLKIYIDPATGKWAEGPVTEEQKREAAAQTDNFDASKVETINHPDGSIEYRMNGQLVDNLVAKRGADGKLHIVCSQHGLESHASGGAETTTTQGGRDER